jgi:hypothetical protein
MTAKDIAEKYGVKKQCVYDIRNRYKKKGELPVQTNNCAESQTETEQGSTPEPKTEPIQSVATTLNEPGMLVAGLHYWDDELVNATIVHARAMLNDLSELDESVRIKVITLARIKNMINEVFNPEVPN